MGKAKLPKWGIQPKGAGNGGGIGNEGRRLGTMNENLAEFLVTMIFLCKYITKNLDGPGKNNFCLYWCPRDKNILSTLYAMSHVMGPKRPIYQLDPISLIILHLC